MTFSIPKPQAEGAPAKLSQTPTPAKPASRPTQKAGQRTAPVAKPFDLNTCSQVYQRRRQVWQTYLQNRLIPIDNYMERRLGEDFVNINNQMYQVQDASIPNLVDKVIAYITPESVGVRVTKSHNPMMDDEQREAVANVIREVWAQDRLYNDGDTFYDRCLYMMTRGNYIAQYEWLPDEEADAVQDGWPFRLWIHDIFNCAPMMGPGRRMDSIIVARKVYASEVPDNQLQAAAPDAEETDELEMFVYYDRTQYGVVINNVIVQDLTPHGYYYPDGVTPMCPFVFASYRPRTIRNGLVAPQASGFSQIGRKIGVPPTYYMLDAAEISSRIMTVEMENVRRLGLAPVIATGVVKRPNDEGMDFTEPVHYLDKDATMTVLDVPDVNEPAQKFVQDIRDNHGAPAGMPNQMLSGQGAAATTPGIQYNHQTSMPRAFAEQLSLYIKHGMESEAQIIAGLCVSKLQASVVQHVQHATGEKLPTLGGVMDPLNQAVVLPFSERFTASATPITDLTFYGFRRADVDVTPDTRLPPEQLAQMGMQALLAKDPQTGKPAMPVSVIAEKFFPGMFEDANELERAIALDMLASQPGNPLAIIKQMEAVVVQYGSRFQPQQLTQMQQALDQYIQTNLPQMFEMLAHAPPPGPPGAPPPNAPQGPPQPPGAPMGGPPGSMPGQPSMMPPGGPPMLPPPNLPPNAPMPTPMGTPMPLPRGPMMPGGGNPAAALPPPANPVPPGPILG
jgi:hypothetical protein